VDEYLAGRWNPFQATEIDLPDSYEEIEIPRELMGEEDDSDWEDVTD